ncbi:MAG: outer membrane beta-barrel protein [Oleibacter sp.]|nr:outer membrane beta-barrel protein [Thalassolituus sp.]
MLTTLTKFKHAESKSRSFKKNILAALTLVVAGSSISTTAYAEEDTWTARVGASIVSPEVSNSNKLKNSLGGGELDADINTQLSASLSYRLNTDFSLELLAAAPFTHDISLKGTGKIASTKQLPPTLSLIYDLPLGEQMPLSVYTGVGVNYTLFFDEQSSLGNLVLDDSVGLALLLGTDIPINDSVGLNASVRWMDINTDVHLNGTNLGELEIDPWVYSFGFAYHY